MNGSRFISNFFKAYDVSHLFFIPVILPKSLAEIDKNTNIKRVMTHSEKAAAYMADGYARASGKPGICMAQKVGAANIAAGLKDAFLACSPVIAITGGPSLGSRNRNTYQEIDDLSMFKSVTKSSIRIDDVSQMAESLRQAFRVSTTGKPGPSHIEIPGQTGEEIEDNDINEDLIIEKEFTKFPAYRMTPVETIIEKAASKLADAKKPIIVAGGGTRSSGAGKELIAFAEKYSIPVATSLNGKDVFPGSHKLAVGIPGLYSNTSANKAILASDLIFFIGSQTGSQLTLDWKIPKTGTKIIQLDIDPSEIGKHYPVEVGMVGDARTTLEILNQKMKMVNSLSKDSWLNEISKFNSDWKKEIADHSISENVPIRPERLCKEITNMMPDNSIVVSDTGHSGIWSGTMIDLNGNSQDYLRAAGSLGWGLPATIGAKAACPERPVIGFTGDGGFWYHMSEIETAVRWNINAVIVVNNNSSLNQEIGVNARAYGGKLTHNHGDLWKFTEVNFKNVAESMGAKGLRVENPKNLSLAFEEALSSNQTCIIDVVTDQLAFPPKPWTGE